MGFDAHHTRNAFTRDGYKSTNYEWFGWMTPTFEREDVVNHA
jgi:hypothetical protein